MPGFDRRLARCPQLYSRIGFAHQYQPLDPDDIPTVLAQYWDQLGRDQVKDGVQRITGELADLARLTARDAERLLINARRALRRPGRRPPSSRQLGVRDAAAGRVGSAGPRRE